MKNILFLGSSVTKGYSTNNYSFVDIIAQNVNFVCNKDAVNGTTLADNDNNSYLKRFYNNFKNYHPDILVVQLSTNDATKGENFGDIINDKFDNFNIKTTYGAIEEIISCAKKLNCRVIFYTNPYFESDSYLNLVKGLYLIKQKWNIVIIYFYKYGLQSEFMEDNIHPNINGYKWMSEIFLRYLLKE